MQKRRLAILGSTGSIGTQTLDIVSKNRELFEVELLTSNNNYNLLIEQAIKFNANAVVICNHEYYKPVAEALAPHFIKVFAGIESISQLLLSSDNIDIVVTAMVGISGLEPTVAAIKGGKSIALANKETLVAAGAIITKLATEHRVPIIPVDSEHSAIFQCLQGERSKIEKILLTASGGPFFNVSTEKMRGATIEEALSHPKWKMGQKITIDSATMMNKGFEMIEARWLFGTSPSDIQIVVHPQSIIHSMVQFEDGSILAQMSSPDMRIPIQYALAYPNRLPLDVSRVDFHKLMEFTFAPPDTEKFPCITLAYQAIEKGGNLPCIMNAANEMAVNLFISGKISFFQIPQIIENMMENYKFIQNPSLEEILKTDKEVREIIKSQIKWT